MDPLLPNSEQDGGEALAHEMATDLRVLFGKLRRKLREEGHLGDFPPSQLSVVLLLDKEGPATVSALAQAEGVRPQSMSATVAALESAGLVEGNPDPSDGRKTVLSLTPFCQEKIRESRAAREDWLYRSIRAKLAPGEQETLASAIELLKRLVDL